MIVLLLFAGENIIVVNEVHSAPPTKQDETGVNSEVRPEVSNAAISKNAEAQIRYFYRGSVSIRNSTVQGMVSNKSRVNQAVNEAKGKGAEAQMGSVSIRDSTVQGMVSNKSRVNQAVNMALGQNAESNMGSVSISDESLGR
ncbi:MAG: hypothetical protein VST67_00155 [Nitrospirota bacterium]|nr:hypothetical protein [Nitrospirota bacterium]